MGRAGGADGARRSATRACSPSPRALVCFAEYAPRRRGAGRAAPASRAPPGSTRSPTSCSPRGSTCPYYLGFAEYFCERYEDAARHLRRGIALARAVGQGQFVVPMMVGLAQALERLGRLREALNTAEAAVEASRLTGNPQAVGFALVAEAWTAAELGDVAHARSAAEEAVALLDALDESVFTRATHAHVGVIWLEIGEPDRCIEQLRAAGAPELPLIEPGRRGWLYTVLARAELEGGDRAAAANWMARARGDGGRPASCRSPRRGCCTPARCWRSPTATRPQAAALALRAAERAEAVQSPVAAPRAAERWRASRSRRRATASRRCGC